MIGSFAYKLLFVVIRIGMFFWHPVFRVVGKENVPAEGKLLICPNHRGMADPIWIVLGMHSSKMPRIMAKKEVMQVPVLKGLLKWLGVFGVDRSGADINAVKTGLKCLKNDQQLMIFPEGTRVKPGAHVEPKGGSILLSVRSGAPILPVYLSVERRPFGPITCVIGEPYMPAPAGTKLTEAEMLEKAKDLMKIVYSLEERV